MILKLADPEGEKHLKDTILTNPKASGILSTELSCWARIVEPVGYIYLKQEHPDFSYK